MNLQRAGGHRRDHLRALLGGLPGCGLTPAAATWPSPLYALAGPGSMASVAGRDLPYVRVPDVDAFLDCVQAVSLPADERAAAVGVQVDTLVVDTLDHLEEQVVGHDPAKMRAILSALANLPLHVVLLCHTRTVEDRIELRTCVADEVGSFVDVALLLASRIVSVVNEDDGRVQRNLVRFMRAWPDVRHPWILDRTGALPSELPLTFEGDFARLAAALGASANGQAPAPAPPETAAPPTSIAPGPVVTRSSPAPAPPAAQAEAEEGDETDDEDVIQCTEGRAGCLGVVEPGQALDISILRHRRAMCPPCEAAVWAEKPKKVKASAKKAPAPAPAAPLATAPAPERPSAVETEAVVPHGEVVGRFKETQDQALRDLLRS